MKFLVDNALSPSGFGCYRLAAGPPINVGTLSLRSASTRIRVVAVFTRVAGPDRALVGRGPPVPGSEEAEQEGRPFFR